MSDYHRNKDFKKKSEYGSSKDYKRGSVSTSTREKKEKDERKGAPLEKKLHPTILKKARDPDRASSPNVTPSTSAPVVQKAAEPSSPYQIQTKSPSIEAPVPLAMTSAVQFLNIDSYNLVESCIEYLSDQGEFLVVGCLGGQGVGKSTILTMLADPSIDFYNVKRQIFSATGLEDVGSSRHQTTGIDLFVTKNRILLLDCQPILTTFTQSSVEHNPELQSLEIAAFLFSVCHVVLFFQDYFLDPDIIRFLQTAEMLKPSTPTSIEEAIIEYFPHLVFVHNKAESWEFNAERIKEMQEIYLKAFTHSRLQIQTGFGISNGDVSPVLTATTCGELINLFLLPTINSDLEVYTGHPSFKQLFRHLRSQILSTPRTPISHTVRTERDWLHYASRVWFNIQKSPFFNEYHRLTTS